MVSYLRLLLIGGMMSFFISLRSFALSVDSYVVEINSMRVTDSEFRIHLNRNIAGTYNYYYQQWGVHPHAAFWETQYGEKTPQSYILEKTLSQLVDIKLKQQLATQMGLIVEFTFDSLQGWWVQDNKDRKLKKSQGGVVYGPVERTFADFYDYFYDRLFIKLQEEVNQNLLSASTSQLEAYYELNKERWFQYSPDAEVEYIEFQYDGSSDRDQVAHLVELTYDKLSKGMEMSTLLSAFPQYSYRHQTYVKTDDVLGEEDVEGQLIAWALELDVDELKIFNGRSSMYIMHCIKKSPKQTYSYDEIKRDVQWYYQKYRYQELLDTLKQNAKINVNDEVLDNIEIQ
ncbi:hypothetical protein N6H18_07940 [Reichenbachiella agarivorans]|uniref:PPIC-type PPIASE domain-containing protein n=1 Tax=Reichenbachiella agarivorans TaxID=2979464 RepID=A0ABY6CU65_9BACT|nr:hypothetical protein [Reichenbachiella agarivorans]UXP33874.1 hypothetical protein N6H18_07940 [Reichenbachiella agarivorans]